MTGEQPQWKEIESRWQAAWREAELFATPQLPEGSRGIYIFAACPFTSGSAHMGHIRSYTIADAYARFRRACGDPVLFSMGFDSFGLPAESGAIRSQVHPQEWVADCCEKMHGQFDAMGFSFDWARTFVSSDEDCYRWSQWLFVTLLERGLIYKKNAQVDWCESCRTVLARSQVEEGRCWRCGQEVTLVAREQWFLRASDYFMESSERLEGLEGWDKNALGSQHGVLGRVDGVEFEASSIDGRSLTVFTPDAENLSSAVYVAMSPSHPELDAWLVEDSLREQIASLRRGGWMRSDRRAEDVAFINTAAQVIVPGVEHALPVIVSPYVDPRYGPSAILGIPQEDAIARVIAERLEESGQASWRVSAQPAKGKPTVRFAAADFPVSRQRAWGAPIPLVHCDRCGTVAVPVEDLPVRLPDGLQFTGAGNPLAEDGDFIACRCPSCEGPARRDTDTLDCHVDGLWMWMPICVPAGDRSHTFFTHPELRHWVPVHQIVWGLDGGSYILSQRTLAKMLRDGGMLEHLPSGEPFERALMHGMIEYDGRKMSKHLGNVVDPSDLIERVGADTVRLAVLYSAAPKNGMSWTEHDVDFCHRFATRLWRYVSARRELLRVPSQEAGIDRADKLRRQLEKWCDIATRKLTRDLLEMQMHRAVRNVMLMLERIEDFERRAIAQRGALDELDERALAIAIRRLVQVIGPLTPHLAEELWALAGNESFLSTTRWPVAMNPDKNPDADGVGSNGVLSLASAPAAEQRP